MKISVSPIFPSKQLILDEVKMTGILLEKKTGIHQNPLNDGFSIFKIKIMRAIAFAI